MNDKYTRPVSPVESLFSLSPFSVVAMVFRIKGHITKIQLEHAINSVQKKHLLLQVRITSDENNTKVFTTENVGSIKFETISMESENHWMDVYHKQCAIPFEFEKNPCIRFILLQSESKCDLIIFSHHIICDGLSLSYLGRDILDSIGNPNGSKPEILNTTHVNKDNLPDGLKQNRFLNRIYRKINKKYADEKVLFDFDDYKNLHKAYWDKYTHQMVPVELSRDDTLGLIESCKTHNISVNTAILTAIMGAWKLTLKDVKLNRRNSVAVNIRNYLTENPGQAMGFYAGGIENSFEYNIKKDFWENASVFHKKIKSRLDIKNIFKNISNWSHLEPGIMESINFKLLGSLPTGNGRDKLFHYSERSDLISSILKRNKMDSLDNIIMGTAITNLGALKIPNKYGNLELDSMIMNPGGAFPLVMVQMVVAVATVSGRMSILLEFEESRLSKVQAQNIKDQFLKLLKIEIDFVENTIQM